MYWMAIGPHRFKMNNLFNFGGKFIYLEGEQSPKYKAACVESVQHLIRNVITILSLLIISITVYSAGPFYVYFFRNVRATPAATKLPFLEHHSDVGFPLNLIQQTVVALYGVTGYISMEIGFCLINNVIITMPKLIRVDLDELTNELQLNGMNWKSTIQLRQILVKMQDFDR